MFGFGLLVPPAAAQARAKAAEGSPTSGADCLQPPGLDIDDDDAARPTDQETERLPSGSGSDDLGAAPVDAEEEEDAAGDEKGEDAEAGSPSAAAGAGGVPDGQGSKKSKQPDDSTPVTRKNLISYLHHCVETWKKAELKVLDKVKADPRVKALARAERQRGGQAPPPKHKQEQERVVQRHLRQLSSEAGALADAVGAASAPNLLSGIGGDPPEVSKTTQENLEKEVRKWSSSFVEKVSAKTANGGKEGALEKNLCAVLSKTGDEGVDETHAMMGPYRQLIEQYIKAELKPQISNAVVGELKSALRQPDSGVALLEAAVDTKMREMAASWADASLSRAAQRLRTSMSSAAIVSAASDTPEAMRLAVREAMQANEGQAQQDLSASASMRLRQQLQGRLRAATAPVEASLQRLSTEAASASQAMRQCQLAGMAVGPTASASDPSSRLSAGQPRSREAMSLHIRSLCAEAKYGAAFQEAAQWDGEAAAQGASDTLQSMTELACTEALEAAVARHPGLEATPEAFMALEPGPLQGSPQVKLMLMAMLLGQAVQQGASMERLTTALDWAVAVCETWDPSEGLSGDADADAAIVEFCSQLARGTTPAALAAAPSATKQRVARSARSVTKQIELLQRLAGGR
eukprot:TRINITY_DN33454_c0_g1_i4.p1 TRINITY_DN33454_c0_g1~~TRINITY_DN33454_c0_g1_i4.p1  ORF type:complete len:635 (-),score=190.92 TRINITY_DN33454_c0_g1_i4:181-2085(-)